MKGPPNLASPTCEFDPDEQFDRIVSVEIEHMMNWRELLMRARSWVNPDGRFFMHIFTHRSGTYLFDRADLFGRRRQRVGASAIIG